MRGVMKQVFRELIPPLLWRYLRTRGAEKTPALRTFEISIDQCVHYCGFRYGRLEYNPYEQYLLDLLNHVPLLIARRRFVEFLVYYRPRHMGEALGLINLSKEYPLWVYPWQRFQPREFTIHKNWCNTPNDFPDILTHFCESGILSFRIDEEFFWLERALYSISENDYQPEHYNSYIRTLQLCRSDGKCAYLLLDGNHRVGTMSVLGHKTVKIEHKSTDIVFERDCDRWYGVQEGFFSREDALRIFNAYFEGNHNYRTTRSPARILAHDDWLKIYTPGLNQAADSTYIST